ncbi:MAG: hypothetical protein ACYCWE_09750 [Eubacteriales bacterium]
MTQTCYIDSRGWKYRVMPGISDPPSYKARYQNDKHTGGTGWHGVPIMKWRETFKEAQADLDEVAKKKGWAVWCVTKI